MTILAIAMGLIRWLAPTEALRAALFGILFSLPAVALLTGAWAATTLASLWMALGARWLAGRLIVFVLAVAVPAVVLTCLIPESATIDWLRVALPQTLIVFISLLVVRLAGYRLTWQRRASAVAGPPDG
jgi:hypothetical protein